MTAAGRGSPDAHRTANGFFAEPLHNYVLQLLPGPARTALWSRRGELTLLSGPAGLSSSVRVTCAAVSRLTRGCFGDGHDELLYVIRKPQDRFARVV